MFLNVGLPMGAVCWTLPPRICCITPLKVCSIWLALISISKWFYNSTQVSNIKTHTDDPQMPLFPNKIKKDNITKRHHSTQLSLKISLPNKICFPQNPSQASLPPPFNGDDFLPFDPEAKAVEGHLHRDEAEAIDRTVGTYTVQIHGLASRRSEACCWRIKTNGSNGVFVK